MAVVFMDGFDNYDVLGQNVASDLSEKWLSVVNLNSGITLQNGNLRGNSIKLDLRCKLTSPTIWPSVNGRSFVVGFNILSTSDDSSGNTLYLAPFSDVGGQGGVFYFSIRQNSVRFGGFGGVTYFQPISLNTWYHIEMKITRVSSNTFDADCYIDGVSVLQATNITRPPQGGNKSSLSFVASTQGISPYHIDNFYLLDHNSPNTDILGANTIIETLFPNGTVSDVWSVLGAATRHEAVSLIPFNQTTRIQTSQSAQTQQFEYQDLEHITNPFAAEISTVIKGNGTLRSVVNGSNVNSQSVNTLTSFPVYSTVFDQGSLDASQIDSINAGVGS